MNVFFETLSVHNFLSIVDLDFDFSKKDYRGINLILGENLDINNDVSEASNVNTVGSDSSNGSGKTTLFAALCFALFGDSIKHIENATLVPNRTMSPGEPVKFDLFVRTDGQRYHIVRTMTGKTRKTTLKVFEIGSGGEENEVTLSTVKLTQAFICNRIVGCNMSMFLRSVLLRNDPSNNFFDLDKASKVKFIEELFDLGVFTEMYSQIHREKLDADKKLFGLGQVRLSLERNLMSARNNFDNWKDDSDIEIANAVSRLEEIEEVVVAKRQELLASDEKLTASEGKLKALESRFPAQREKVNGLYRKIQELKSEVVIANNDIGHAEKLMQTHRKTRDILCDDCRAKFDGLVHFGDLEAKKTSASDKIVGLKERLDGVQSEYESENAKLTKGNDILSNKKSEFFDVQRSSTRLRTEVSSIEKEISTLKAFISAPRKAKANPYLTIVEQSRRDLEKNSCAMADAEANVRKLTVLEGVVSPDTIRNIVISGLVSELNLRIKYYLQRMGATYTCVFDKSLDYKFVTTSGETGYGNFSKGEEMRLSVATTLAFRDFMLVRSNMRTNILLIDEYLDSSLDRLAKRGIMTLFSEFVAENKEMGVFLISHDEYIKNMDFSSVLRFTKKNDVSSLEVDIC